MRRASIAFPVCCLIGLAASHGCGGPGRPAEPPVRIPSVVNLPTVPDAATPTTVAAATCTARSTPAGWLPDPSCTPGATDAAVTQTDIGETICVRGWTATVRPPLAWSAPRKRAAIRVYGAPAGPSMRSYEFDHLIPLELGGAPRDAANLWPEPGGTPNAKDRVEDALNAAVCDHVVGLAAAQHAIASDWTRAENIIPEAYR